MRKGEVGKTLRVGVDFDLTTNTSLALIIDLPSGAQLSKTQADLTIGATDISTEFGTFKAGEWYDYTFQAGELSEAGLWNAVLTYNGSAGQVFISDPARFNVLE